MNDFAVFALLGNLLKGMIMVLGGAEQAVISMYPNPHVLFCVALSNFECSIFAAVIYDQVFPVLICLSQYAFNAFRQIAFTVVSGRDNAD